MRTERRLIIKINRRRTYTLKFLQLLGQMSTVFCIFPRLIREMAPSPNLINNKFDIKTL